MRAETPKGNVVSAVQTASEGGSIFSRFVFGLWSDEKGAMNAAVNSLGSASTATNADDVRALRYLNKVDERASVTKEKTVQFAQEQVSGGAGEVAGQATASWWWRWFHRK